MASTVDLHSQIASIMEVLANAAVAEICRLVDDRQSVIQLEVSRSQKETEILQKKIELLELRVARYRADSLKAAEGSVSGPFPVTRHLLGRQRGHPPPGTSQQTKNRYLNRRARSPLSVQKPPPFVQDQDQDQEVVTTTETEQQEEEEKELVIVKVRGSMEIDPDHQGAPSDIIRGDPDPPTLLPTTMREDGGQLSEAQRRLALPYSSKREPEINGKVPQYCPSLVHLLMGWKEEKHNGDTQQPDTANRAGGTPFRPLCDLDLKSPKSEPEIIEIDMGQEDYCAPLSVEPRAAESPSRPHRDRDQSKSEPEVTEIDSGQNVCYSAMSFEDRGDGAEGPAGSQFPALIGIPPVESAWDISTFRAQQQSWSGVNQMDNFPVQNLVHPTPSMENTGSGSQQHRLSFSCTLCPRRFAHKCSLSTHMHTHTGAKPYACQQCGKRFAKRCVLKRHQFIHTGDRPFPCKLCGKLFSTSTNLKTHQIVHTRERLFQCPHCEKRYSTSANLKHHLVVHTGGQQSHCFRCGRDFCSYRNLTRHIRKCTRPSDPGPRNLLTFGMTRTQETYLQVT